MVIFGGSISVGAVAFGVGGINSVGDIDIVGVGGVVDCVGIGGDCRDGHGMFADGDGGISGKLPLF